MDARRIILLSPLMGAALVVVLAVWGCASAPVAKPAPELSPEQQRELAQAEKMYRSGAPGFDAERDRLAADPAAAYWLARLFVFHLVRAHDLREADDDTFLATATGTQDPTVTRAIEQLRLMGAAAVPALIEDLLRSKHSDRRQFGAMLLSEMGPQVLPDVTPLLDDSDWHVRRMVVQIAVPMESTPEVIAVLERGTHDESFAVRATALTGLLGHGEDQVERVRRVLTEDPDRYVQRVVAEALGDYADRETAEVLVAYYGECMRRSDAAGAKAAEASLAKISGHKRSGDLKFWRTWLSGYSGKEQR